MMYSCAPRGSGEVATVKTRKSKTLRVDIHCHYLNPEAAARVAERNPGQYEPSVKFANALTRETNAKQMKERAPRLSSAELRLEDMDRMGIDVQAVSPAPNQTYYWTEPGEGRELARMVNERLAEICAQWPERFVGLGTVPLQDPELAVQELEYLVKRLGLRGVEINPSPLETTVAASHLIFDGVMDRYPGLKVVLPHAGGYLAHYWARMDHAWKARPDCRTVIRKKPSSYLEKFYFDTLTFDPGMLKNLVERFGADHVLLGSDYPYDMGVEHPVEFIESVPRLTRADKERIMGKNAARLLKLKRGGGSK